MTGMDARNTLAGKVGVITGGSSGIGMALAERLSAMGMRLVVHGRRNERLATLSDEPRVICMSGDLTTKGAVQGLKEAALSSFGRVDYAINNAGINHTGTIEQIDEDRLCDMVRINVEAAYRFSYTFLKCFQTQNAGHLIHTTSVMGYKVRETAGGYAGTKHAVEALCEALRLELARTAVKVSCVAPGLVDTELHRDSPVKPAIARNIPRPLSASDVADAIVWVMLQPAHINVPQLVLLPQDHQI